MHGQLCQILKNRPATVHITAIDEDNGVIEIHLSSAAVRKLGIDLHDRLPTVDEIRHWLTTADTTSEETALSPSLNAPTLLVPSGINSPSCEHCSLTYDEFIESNRFGCEHCYNAFAGRLDRALKDLHGHNRHIGRTPTHQQSNVAQLRNERDQLKRQLASAVADEHYEEAARVRDRLRELEAELGCDDIGGDPA